MKQNLFSASLLAVVFTVSGVCAFAQQNPPTANADNPCQELKPEQVKQLKDDARKKYEEEIKACKDALTKNAKIKNSTEVVNRVLKEGNSAMDGKNYDVAVAKYEEGYQADPDFWGTAPVLLRNKAIALRARGVDKFNAAVKNTDKDARSTGVADAGKDFQGSVDALQKAIDVLNKTTAPTAPAEAKNFEASKSAVIADRAESYRLLVKADSSKAAEGVKAYEEYLAVETDPAKKSKAQFTAADLALESGDANLAVTEFQKIVQQDPNNSKAMYKLGIALISQAANENNDKAKIQDGVNYLQKFVDSAPDTDTDKEYAKATIEAMKAEQNVAPQKGAGRATGKRKS